MRSFPAIIIIALIVIGAAYLAAQPGSVVLTWEGRHIYTSVARLALGVVLLAMLAAALFHLLRKLLGGPRAFLRARRERRRREGYRALTQGMVAVAAGDAEEAGKFARKADVLLAEPPLTLLLSAQAAQLSGDEQAAAKYFQAMLERPETEFLGLRGLVMQALRAGDEPAALELVERARRLRPRTPWVMSSLYELQARAGKWSEAETTLAEAVKRKALTEAATRHHRTVLLHERSRAAEAAGAQRQALLLAAEAHGAELGFAPGAVHYAGLLRVGGRTKHAARALEASWRAAPHPDLAEAWLTLLADETPVARVKETERLASAHPDHVESRLAQARAALAARLWGEARRHLEALGARLGDGAAPVSPRICRLMAELEEAQHENMAAARAWLGRAATTTALDPAWVCGACGGESAGWSALCPHCRAFASLAWRLPGGSAQRLSAPAPSLMPALPVPAPSIEAPPQARLTAGERRM
ncbi:MAG TPA: heme biosynthesis HemY N-terminal domain-containing protein [Stellaceae bacterium]|nr:heme biosynthesis HemY N-terminal domain-containing protein [Stellaceae bacterium]